MSLPQIVSPAEWETARAALLVKEKQATRARDALAAERRRLPMVRVEKLYVFEGPDGEVSLPDLFDGRRQLVIYHHMLKPGDDDPCSGCAMFVDNIGHLAHLHARDTSLALVSRAPSAEIKAFKKRMGWTIPLIAATRARLGSSQPPSAGRPADRNPLIQVTSRRRRPPAPGLDRHRRAGHRRGQPGGPGQRSMSPRMNASTAS